MATVTVNPPVDAEAPIIATQPQGVTVNVGATATLTVEATSLDGGVLTYQWYSLTTNSNPDELIPDATGKSFTVPTSVAGAFNYYVMVTNTIEDNGDDGQKTATTLSNVATVTVNRVTGGDEIPPVNPLTAWVHNETLYVSGLTPGKVWRLFSVSGALVQQGVAERDVVEIPLKTQGVYIIQSEDNTVKVVSN